MPSSVQEYRLLTSSCLRLPGILAVIFAVFAFGGLFGASYGLKSVDCPVLFLSNLADKFLSRSVFTYFITIAAFMYSITIFLHFVDIKLRLKWNVVEGDIDKYFCVNTFSLVCGLLSMLGFIGIAAFPFDGMPVVQSFYYTNNSNETNSIITSTLNIVHIIHVGFGYAGFFLYAWLVFLLNFRTRSSYSGTCDNFFLGLQTCTIILLTIFSNTTVLAMIIMSVLYHLQPDTISVAHPECFSYSTVGYYAHLTAITSQYITTISIILFGVTLLPPLSKKTLFISLDEPTIYSLSSNHPPETDTSIVMSRMNGDVRHPTASKRSRLSDSSEMILGNLNTGSQSNSLFDVYKETNL